MTTSGKGAAKSAASAKPAKAARQGKAGKAPHKTAEAAAGAAVETGAEAGLLKKKTLVARVAEKAGVKKTQARDVIDAALAEIAGALSRGEALHLPPLGKARVNRQKEAGSGEVLIVKIRRGGKGGGRAAEEGLAAAED